MLRLVTLGRVTVCAVCAVACVPVRRAPSWLAKLTMTLLGKGGGAATLARLTRCSVNWDIAFLASARSNSCCHAVSSQFNRSLENGWWPSAAERTRLATLTTNARLIDVCT
jgi:hypothetical protein